MAGEYACMLKRMPTSAECPICSTQSREEIDVDLNHVEIDAADLALMLEGIELGTVKRNKRFKLIPQLPATEKSSID